MAEWDADLGEGGPGEHVADPMVAGAVRAAMVGLDDLEDVPLAGHVGRFDSVHRTLADALAAIDGN